MDKRHKIEAVNISFRDIMNKDAPFGGKDMVLGGYLRLVLPFVPKSTCAETVTANLVRSSLMKNIQLPKNMRAKADTSFCEVLLHIDDEEETIIKNNLGFNRTSTTNDCSTKSR